MIKIKMSETKDIGTCDYTKVSIDTLHNSTLQHVRDVKEGMDFFCQMLTESAKKHDEDKIYGIESFHSDFLSGFEKTDFWDAHRKRSRHHLLQKDGIPSDVNLIDVIELIVDCVMSGMARKGEFYPIDLGYEVLLKAFYNTVELFKNQIIIERDENEKSS